VRYICICDWRSIKQATPKDDFVSHQTGDALVDCLSIVVAAVVAFVVVVVSVSNISNVQLKSSLVFFFGAERLAPGQDNNRNFAVCQVFTCQSFLNSGIWVDLDL